MLFIDEKKASMERADGTEVEPLLKWFYGHHMCVRNENKTHNLASLKIDEWQQWAFIAVRFVALSRSTE